MDPLMMARAAARNGVDEDAQPVDNPEVQAAIRPVSRAVRADPRAAGIANLGMVPGTPGYAARIPPPEKLDAAPALILPDSHPPAPDSTPVAHGSRRVAIYTPRQPDVFSVQIEEAPDWETVASFRIPEGATIEVVRVLRALGVKISDKTGGDLLEATERYESGPDRTHRRQAAKGPRPRPSAGRTQRADRASDDQWSGIAAEIGALDAPAGERDDDPGPARG